MPNKKFQNAIVFINYRRKDALSDAGRLASDLDSAFGEGLTFQDVDDLQSGDKWIDKLLEAGKAAKVILAIIGPKWFEEKEGKIRLFNEDDWVRKELRMAIEAEKVIIPILIDDTSLPKKEQLPEDLHALLDHESFNIRIKRWKHDIKPLIADIKKITGIATLAEQRVKRNYLVSGVSILSIFAFAFLGMKLGLFDTSSTSVDVPQKQKTSIPKKVAFPSMKIGNYTWMTSNIDTLFDDAYCYQNKVENCKKYGGLYTWTDAMEVCPDGWHLPTEEEWAQLILGHGGLESKEAYQALTVGGNSNFNASLGGVITEDGDSFFKDEYGYYWTSTENGQDSAWFFNFIEEVEFIYLSTQDKNSVASCRCVKDKSLVN